MDLKDVGASGMRDVAFALSEPAENYINDSQVEMLWAMKAIEHAEVHFNLISSVDPRNLRLTDSDDRMLAAFKEAFRDDFQLSPLIVDQLKSEESKEKWRVFIKDFETLTDYNFLTLLRIDAAGDYSEDNTLVVPRVQFLTIEVARNRAGFNDNLRAKYPAKAKEQQA